MYARAWRVVELQLQRGGAGEEKEDPTEAHGRRDQRSARKQGEEQHHCAADHSCSECSDPLT